MFVVPQEGRAVHDPLRGDLLPAAGREVDSSNYWYRRIADGDVKVTAAPVVVQQIQTVTETEVVSDDGTTAQEKSE